jgi:hypothetical protein
VVAHPETVNYRLPTIDAADKCEIIRGADVIDEMVPLELTSRYDILGGQTAQSGGSDGFAQRLPRLRGSVPRSSIQVLIHIPCDNDWSRRIAI